MVEQPAHALSREQAAARRAASRSRHQAAVARRMSGHLLLHLMLIAISIALLVPLAWVVSTSLKSSGTEFQFPPQWIPKPVVWQNYPKALTAVPFAIFFRNSVFISVMATVGSVITGSWAAFAFARLRFPGRDLLFGIALSTLMVPYVVTLIPSFVIFKELHWTNTFAPLIVPSYFGGGAFNIFLMRQFFRTLPRDLDDAARADGANGFWIWARIIMPLSKPALATVGIFVFIFHWNDFLAPLIYLNTEHNFTLALGLAEFQDQYGNDFNLMMAASVVMIVPVMIIFFVGLRYFVRGIALTGLAGR